MKYITILLYIIFLLANVNCAKESNSDIIVNQDSIKVVWSRPLTDDYTYVVSITPILNDSNQVLFSNWNKLPFEEFRLYNKDYGTVMFKWHDYLRNEEIFTNYEIYKVKDKIILCSNNASYLFNINTGQTISKNYFDTMFGSSRFFLDLTHDNVFQGFHGEKGTYNYYLFYSSTEKLNWHLKYTFHDSSLKFDNLTNCGMSFFKINGETQVVNTLVNGGSSSPSALMFSYNIDRGKLNWLKNYENNYSEFHNNANLLQKDSIIYTMASNGLNNYMVAINANNGDIIWQKDAPHRVNFMKMYGDQILCSFMNTAVVNFIDRFTGITNKSMDISPKSSDYAQIDDMDVIIHKNYLFATLNKSVCILDLDKQELIFNTYIPGISYHLKNGVAIDEKKRVMYAADEVYAYCLTLPKNVIFH